jgi:hypothetical protein
MRAAALDGRNIMVAMSRLL